MSNEFMDDLEDVISNIEFVSLPKDRTRTNEALITFMISEYQKVLDTDGDVHAGFEIWEQIDPDLPAIVYKCEDEPLSILIKVLEKLKTEIHRNILCFKQIPPAKEEDEIVYPRRLEQIHGESIHTRDRLSYESLHRLEYLLEKCDRDGTVIEKSTGRKGHMTIYFELAEISYLKFYPLKKDGSYGKRGIRTFGEFGYIREEYVESWLINNFEKVSEEDGDTRDE